MYEVTAAEKIDSEIPECQKFLIYFPEQKIFIRSFVQFIVVGVSLFTLSSARYANQAGMWTFAKSGKTWEAKKANFKHSLRWNTEDFFWMRAV